MEIIVHNLNDENEEKAMLTASCMSHHSSYLGSSYINVLTWVPKAAMAQTQVHVHMCVSIFVGEDLSQSQVYFHSF